MFSGGMDVALAYRTTLEIINDSSSKRTTKSGSAAGRWAIVFKVRHIYKDSHNVLSKRMVFLGILDFSNGEGGSSIDGW